MTGQGGAARRTALVTGARRGIGRGIALALAARGFDVIVNDIERDAAAEETLAAIAQHGVRAAFLLGDVADRSGHAAFVDAAYAPFGRLDCLVNNAGVSVLSRGDLLDVSDASYDRAMRVNLDGPFFLTQHVARRMITEAPATPEGARSIVFISSINAEIVAVERGEYCLSKTGVSMMAKLYAARLGPHGIAVYEIRPGIIRTDMTAGAKHRYDPMIAGGLTPFARWGEPEDIGRTVAVLASGDLPFSTGAAFAVDGGLHMHRL